MLIGVTVKRAPRAGLAQPLAQRAPRVFPDIICLSDTYSIFESIAPAQTASSYNVPRASMRPRAASSSVPERSVEEIMKQTAACAHDSSALQSAHGPCMHGRRGTMQSTSERVLGIMRELA